MEAMDKTQQGHKREEHKPQDEKVTVGDRCSSRVKIYFQHANRRKIL